jgi:hypothetical protein
MSKKCQTLNSSALEAAILLQLAKALQETGYKVGFFCEQLNVCKTHQVGHRPEFQPR